MSISPTPAIRKAGTAPDAGRFHEAEMVLGAAEKGVFLGYEDEQSIRRVAVEETARIERKMVMAIASEQKGNLDVAADCLSDILEPVKNGEENTARALELARLLDMKLHSAGRLCPWRVAFGCRP